MEESDLKQVARKYGLSSYREFERMILESDGSITGVLRSEGRGGQSQLQEKPVG